MIFLTRIPLPVKKQKLRLLPKLNYQIWILAIGRFLLEFGTGFTLFYAPIFFVNKVGLSATSVGIALGSASLSGILGRILSGSFSDSPILDDAALCCWLRPFQQLALWSWLQLTILLPC